MGAGSRAGWYSYDCLDNGRQPSATRIRPELQLLRIGMVFPALPGATDGFVLLAFEPDRFVVLGWPSPDGPPLVTWAFVLREVPAGTRLVVRARAGPDYTFRGLPPWVGQRVIRSVHFTMQRRQLIGIATRAERLPPATASARGQDAAVGRTPALQNLAVWVAAGLAAAAAAYAVSVGLSWSRYGRPPQATDDEEDPLLDRLMPAYDVVERHQIRVRASAAATLDAARDQQLLQLPVVRAVVRARELILGAVPDDRPRPRGLLAEVQSLGWVVLAEVPDREVVVGAVTKPWEPNVTFRAVPPEAFAGFAEPDYVKIAWTLRADPLGDRAAMFRTETRVLATDTAARAKFRQYWAFLSPGIRLIRRVSLRPLKAAAEARAHQSRTP
jgi:hypothetical protein